MMRVLLIDNYDSFTYNIAHVIGRLGAEVVVMRNDDPTLDVDRLEDFPLVVVGPGPGRPAEAGVSPRAIERAVARRVPLFGVCLGQQAIGEHFGASVVHAPALMHGKTSEISHDGTGVFANVPQRFTATRYHSLCVAEATIPPDLCVTARSDDGVVQGVAHRDLPMHAVQFHPESILTPAGATIFANMLDIARAHAAP